MPSNPLKRCAKYIIVVKNIITFECNREDRTFINILLHQPMKRLYLDHFDELPGHFDYRYFYASSSSLESIHYG